VTSSDAGPVVTVEVLVKKQQVSPVGIVLELVRTSVDWAPAVFPGKKPDLSARQNACGRDARFADFP